MNTRKERPFVVMRGLNQHTLEHEESKMYFDVVYPARWADGSPSDRGEAIDTQHPSHALGSRSVLTSVQYFIIRQLWPECCAVDEDSALQLVAGLWPDGEHEQPQMELFR